MLRCNIANQLLDQYRFSNSGTAEQTDLSAFCIRCKQINDLDTGLEHLDNRALLRKARCFAVDTPMLLLIEVFSAVDRLAEHVEQPAQRFLADWHLDAASCSRYFHILMKSVT